MVACDRIVYSTEGRVMIQCNQDNERGYVGCSCEYDDEVIQEVVIILRYDILFVVRNVSIKLLAGDQIG